MAKQARPKDIFSNPGAIPGEGNKSASADKMALIPSLNKDEKNISPAQKTFNRLAKQISRLKGQIGQIPQRQESIRIFYEKEIHPVLMQAKVQEIENLRLMSEWYESGKLTPRRVGLLGGLMLECAYYIMDRFGDDPAISRAMEDFLERYREAVTGISDEELEKQEVELMAAMSKDVFGLDFDDLVDDAADLNDFLNKAGDRVNNRPQPAGFEEHAGGGTRKSPNTTRIPAKQKIREQLEQKSLRDIYIEMVRELHPDRAGDDPNRKLREERMKELTRAYRDKDLFALLSMQLNWMSESERDFAGQPDSVLKQYNKIMKKQVQKLQEEYECFRYKTIPGLPAEYGSFLTVSKRELHVCLYYEKKEREQDLFSSRIIRKALNSKQQLNKWLDEYSQDRIESESDRILADVLMGMGHSLRR